MQFLPPAGTKTSSLREVRARDIGHLVSVQGMVTRVTDVKPLVKVATYTCDACGFEIYQEVRVARARAPAGVPALAGLTPPPPPACAPRR